MRPATKRTIYTVWWCLTAIDQSQLTNPSYHDALQVASPPFHLDKEVQMAVPPDQTNWALFSRPP